MGRQLNLGCGHIILPTGEGWVNMDANPLNGVDIVAKAPPLPFPDETFDHILASHIIEHIYDTVELMNECWRVMKPGGHMKVYVPYAMSHAAFQDPTHIKFFVPESFMYYNETMAYLNYGIKVWSRSSGWLMGDGWQVEADLYK